MAEASRAHKNPRADRVPGKPICDQADCQGLAEPTSIAAADARSCQRANQPVFNDQSPQVQSQSQAHDSKGLEFKFSKADNQQALEYVLGRALEPIPLCVRRIAFHLAPLVSHSQDSMFTFPPQPLFRRRSSCHGPHGLHVWFHHHRSSSPRR